MKPYYEADGITIYHGDALEVLPNLQADSIISDPPYGIRYQSFHNSNRDAAREWKAWTRTENFAPIHGDDKPFDPSHLMGFEKIVLFGANHYASRLPDSKAWIVWDKKEYLGQNDQADAELIWTNLSNPTRIFRHMWSGLIRRGAENVSRQPKLHPNQKPIALMEYLVKLADPSVVLDPYMGSGTTLVAAKNQGRKSIGVEIEERYCEVAAKRLAQSVMQFTEQAN